MTAEVQPREIAILETVEDIQNRRDQVLRRYAEFKEATRARRRRLEDAKRFHQFKRDADEVEAWINEKLQIASDESYRDPTNLQVSVSSRRWQWIAGILVVFICKMANNNEIWPRFAL